MVEHRLAKARVASSSLVSRSIPQRLGQYVPGQQTECDDPHLLTQAAQGAVPKW